MIAYHLDNTIKKCYNMTNRNINIPISNLKTKYLRITFINRGGLHYEKTQFPPSLKRQESGKILKNN